jgi:hypothetical protein
MPEGTAITTRGRGLKRVRRPDLLDEVPQHRLRDLKVGNDAVFEWANGHDVAGRAPKHSFRFIADCQHFIGAGVNCDYRGFAKDDAVVLHVNEGVRSSEIDSYVIGK